MAEESRADGLRQDEASDDFTKRDSSRVSSRALVDSNFKYGQRKKQRKGEVDAGSEKKEYGQKTSLKKVGSKMEG